VALNFPNSPSVGQIFLDTTSGFYYEWTGVVWKSYSPSSTSQIKVLDDISSSFDDSTTTFALTSSAAAITPINAQSLIINLGGVVQDASDDYSISGSNIVFTTAPQSGLTFSGISLGPAINLSLTDIQSTDDTSTDSNFFPVFVSGTSASATLSTPNFQFNPSTGILSTRGASVGSAVTIADYGIHATGVVTATSFSGDGSQLTGGGVGIQSGGTLVAYGATIVNFVGSGASVRDLGSNTVEVLVSGGGGGSALGISSDSFSAFVGTGVSHINFVGAAVTNVGLTTSVVTINKSITIGRRADSGETAHTVNVAGTKLQITARDGSTIDVPA